MAKFFSFLFFLVGIFFITSCDNETGSVDEEALGYAYAPMQIGKYWIYKSDSIVYKLNGTVRDSLSGYIKEEITDTFVGADDEKAYRIERFFKRNLNDSWGVPRIWTATKNNLNFIRTEENLKFVKLVFPPDLNTFWDGNVFIDPAIKYYIAGDSIPPYKGFWDYKVDSIGLNYTNQNISSDDVIKIIQVDDEDFLEKRYSEEQYARDIGMVYKKMIILDTQCDPCIGTTFEEYAETGFILELSLIESN